MTSTWMMAIISKHARVVALALALGAVALTVSADQAHARPRRPVDSGVRCAVTRSDGSIDFYLPVESARDQHGHWKYCGDDGQWHSILRTLTGPRGPRG